MKTRVSALAYPMEDIHSWEDYRKKIYKWIEQAKKSKLIVFSEYAGFELAGMKKGTPQEQCNFLNEQLDQYLQFYQTLAKEFDIYIQPGTIVVKGFENTFCNRAYFFSPNGNFHFQDKIFLTPDERENNTLQPGNELKVFDTKFGLVGIAICYDSEFPMLVYQLAKTGARLILVPSCTTTVAGHTRVSVSCRARAIENQCYVIQSPLLGRSYACGFAEKHFGQVGIYGPADLNFPDDGILAQGKLNKVQLISAELDWEKLDLVRMQGQVANFNDTLLYRHPQVLLVNL